LDVAPTWRATERTILMANIGVGDRFPAVVLPDERGEAFDLRSELARGPFMLVFYRGDW
jgi:peroxiredoxin